MRVHGRVVHTGPRGSRGNLKGDCDESPSREVPAHTPQIPEEHANVAEPDTLDTAEDIITHIREALDDNREWGELQNTSPAEFATYLVQLAAEARTGEAAQPVHGVQDTEDEGVEQPIVGLGGDPSVFTRRTEPHSARRVEAILAAVAIGPDLSEEQRTRVREFIAEFADCYALSMKEVMPIPGAEHTMNIPEGQTFTTKPHQRSTTPAQKEWYNGVIDEMLDTGIIAPMDPKDVKCVSPTTLAQKAH
ncbi:hypothetical protein C8R44DRAFT_602993, partial [Mycena epipterygia]